MSFAGHVLDMMKRMKKNRALQKKNRSSFSHRARNAGTKAKVNYVNEDFQELSESEKLAIRTKLTNELALDRRNLLLIRSFFIIVFIGSLLLFYIWFYL